MRFFGADPPTIADPRELARRMASKARLLRDGIGRILRQEGRSGPLRDMLGAYREVLIAGLSDEAFADLQAQTAAYGLFAARCLQGEGGQRFTRQSAAFADTTPFLRDVFGRIAGPGIDPRIAWARGRPRIAPRTGRHGVDPGRLRRSDPPGGPGGALL